MRDYLTTIPLQVSLVIIVLSITYFRRAAELGIELSLAGHTHGGQVRVEIVDHSWCPARFMTNFVAGLYRLPFATDANTSSTD